MRTKYFALAAMVLGLASCQTDPDVVNPIGGGNNEVDFRLAVNAPELTRAGENGAADTQNAMDSAYGAIDYLQGAVEGDYRQDWGDVDLRYTLEVYDKADDYTGAMPVKDRKVIIVDEYSPVTFDLRLVPNREYHFVVFADFVAQGAFEKTPAEQLNVVGIRHEIGNTLADITVINETINDEVGDAYFATKDIMIKSSAAQDIVLRRPYGKLRVIATDLAELNLNVNPKKVTVEYETFNPNKFNALTGAVDGESGYAVRTFDGEYIDNVRDNMNAHRYTAGYDAMTATAANGTERHTHITLFTDYILGSDMEGEQTPIHFKMSVYDGDNSLIKTTLFDTEIPIERNHLTTIIGNVLTTATDINVTIDDNFANKDNQYYVFEAFVNGGELTLEEDYTIGRTLYVEADAVLNLNGHTIKNTADNALTDVIVVKEGAKLTINGDGTIEAVSGNDGYAIVVEGELVINDGTYKAGKDANDKANAVIYARGNGKVSVNGGTFPNDAESTFVLNKKDADRATTTIEVRGGKFRYFNPANNSAEGANTNFMAEGFSTTKDGDWYIVIAAKDFVDKGDYAEVYTANGLLKWAYMVQSDNTYGVKLMSNIDMPALTIAEDAANNTYVFTDTAITVTDGVPSDSNWPVISDYERVNAGEMDYYGGKIDGNDMTISGLRINYDLGAVGFLCWTQNAGVENLTFDDAVVYNHGGSIGESYTGIVIGRCWDGSYVNNCHVTNSTVTGTTEVGGIVGRVYHRTEKASGEWLGEKQAYVVYCSTDKNTSVNGISLVGGIAGQNYGCVVGQCVNNADVTGVNEVGGIVGKQQSYYKKTDAFTLGCRTTKEATITATNGAAGGFAGHALRNNSSHTNTRVWFVGCASESTVVGTQAGSMIGNSVKNHGEYGPCLTANYAVTNSTKIFGKGSAPQIEASYNVASVSEITQAQVDEMNAAIEAFNVSPDNVYVDGENGAEMLKRWALVDGMLVLQ